MAVSNPGSLASPKQQPAETLARGITPELVRQVADKVYQRLLEDLTIERERRRGMPLDQRGGGDEE
jgi:hypothetical protein